MFLAVTVGPVAALLGALALVVVSLIVGGLIVAGLFLLARKPVPPVSGAKVELLSQNATLAAFVAKTEGLGVFKNLFEAIAKNDRESLLEEAQYLSRVVKDSRSFASTLEEFVLAQLRQRLQDPSKKRSLIDFIGSVLSIDLSAAIETATKTTPSTSVVPAILLAFALAFGCSTAVAADAPQLYEATERAPVIDPPTFPQAKQRLVQGGPQAPTLAQVFSAHRPAAAAPSPQSSIGWKRLGSLTFDDLVWQHPSPSPYYGTATRSTPIGGPQREPAFAPYRYYGPPYQVQPAYRTYGRWGWRRGR